MVVGNYQYYNGLLSYRELVQLLIKKYGEVTDDFFREKSYARFLNEEIKTPAKGKYSRALEGLYCHHIFENKYENIGNLEFIRAYKYPYELQRKANLVYCDLVEHLILHVLIMKETNGKFGPQGFKFFIRPMVVDWYIEKRKKPKREWYLAVFNRSFLFKDDATKLLKNIDLILLAYAKNTVEDRVKRERQEMKWEDERVQEKCTEFYSKYPNLKSEGISFKTSRKDVVKLLQAIDTEGRNISFKKYYSNLNHLNKDELLARLDKSVSGQSIEGSGLS